MGKDIEVSDYFREYAAQVGSMKGIIRAVNCLVRGRVETMNQLCGMTDEQISRVRNLGEVTKALVCRVKTRYMAERGNQGIEIIK